MYVNSYAGCDKDRSYSSDFLSLLTRKKRDALTIQDVYLRFRTEKVLGYCHHTGRHGKSRILVLDSPSTSNWPKCSFPNSTEVSAKE